MAHAAQGTLADASAPPAGSTWPHQLSHEPLLRVGDVLRLVGMEFPALSPSKLRFFDRQGLVIPQRTASGYRQYSASDVERLRYVLREQRDFYRPLSAIQEALARLDSGQLRLAITVHEAAQEAAVFVSARALAALAGAPEAFIDDLIRERLIQEQVPGGFHRNLAPLVTALHCYVDAGGDLHQARLVRHAADRELEQARAAALPWRSRGEAGAADAAQRERLQAAARLFSALVDVDTEQ